MREFLVAILAAGVAAPAATWVGRFTAPGPLPEPWRMVKYAGTPPTAYRISAVAGRMAIEAKAENSMSLMARPLNMDLAEKPVVCWRWFVDGPVAKANMTRKSGDDYAARIYLAFDMPDSALSGSTKMKLRIARSMFGKSIPDAAVVYVWDNRHPVGTARKSSYTDRSQLVVAETGSARAGTWVTERADVGADFARAFLNKPGKLVQLAVAADGDNTRSKGRAAFTDIHFVGRDQPCAF